MLITFKASGTDSEQFKRVVCDPCESANLFQSSIDDLFRTTSFEILDAVAFYAHDVVMVCLLRELVVSVTVFKIYSSNNALCLQCFHGSIQGHDVEVWQCFVQRFYRKGIAGLSQMGKDGTAGLRRAEPRRLKDFLLLAHGLPSHARTINKCK